MEICYISKRVKLKRDTVGVITFEDCYECVESYEHVDLKDGAIGTVTFQHNGEIIVTMKDGPKAENSELSYIVRVEIEENKLSDLFDFIGNDEYTDEVRNNLIDCLDGEISIREFYHWFVPFAWEMNNKFVNMISLRFAEYTSGHWTKEDLRERFKEILDEEVPD